MFNFTLDEVSLMKKVQFTGERFVGFVDLGSQSKLIYNEENMEDIPVMATHCLMFALVGINCNLKVPIAYYLIEALNGEAKSILVKNALTKLSENKINVRSISFDGISSNITMCEFLGAKMQRLSIDKVVTFFKHLVTGEIVYLYLDPSHMLKLLRNVFANKGIIIDGLSNKVINYKYMLRIIKLQNAIGLRYGNKLKKRHIYFNNEKMRTPLVAQLLNSFSAAS